MADFYNDPVGFIFGGNTGLSYSDLQRRRQIAVALASRARKFPTNLGEGLTYFGEALGDTIQDRRLSAAEQQYKGGEDARERGYTPSTYIPKVFTESPATGATPSPAVPAGAPAGTAANPITAPPTVPSSLLNPQSIETQPPAVDSVPAIKPVPAVAPVPRAGMDVYGRGIAGIESGGARDPYALLGARTKTGDRAIGKYQIMGANVPSWTEAALGRRMTPEEFRADPEAQEATFRNRFGQYVDKYGPEGAARAWYAGERGMKNLGATDVHGRLTVAGYGQDFMRRLGGAQGPAGAPTGSRDAIAAQMAGPPAGPPTPQELASQKLLQETVGVGGGGPLYPPTASAGRAGVITDAPSMGASPLGAVTDPSIGDTLQRQRGGGVGGIMPPAQPTVLPQVAQVRARSVPVTASDASMGALPGSVAPPPGFGAPPAAPQQGPPSDIPQMSRPPITKEPAPPRVYGPDAAMERDMRIMNSDVSPLEQQRAQARYGQAKSFMDLANQREQERYKNERELWEKEPMRKLDERIKINTIAESLAKATNQPVEAEKLRLERDKLILDRNRMQHEQGEPRELELRKQRALTEQAEQAARMGRAPPREKIGERILERQQDGTWKDVSPGEAFGNIKLTESQAKSLKFLERSTLARSQGGDFSAMAGLTDTARGKVPIAGNYLTSEQYQAQDNAADAWIESTLRDVSGAVIPPSEYATQKKIYFPQPGDSPQLMKDKQARRENAERGLYDGLGTAKPIADKFLDEHKAREEAAIPEGTVQVSPSSGKKRVRRGGKWEEVP